MRKKKKTSYDCSIRTQAASQMRVSLLKFEPRVSNFPALEARWLLVLILQREVFFFYFLSLITRSIALITPLFSFVSVTVLLKPFTSSVAFPIAIGNPAY